MAAIVESANSLETPFPQGLFPINFQFGVVSTGEDPIQRAFIPVKCKVKKVYVSSGTITNAAGGGTETGPKMSLATIEVTPQTICALAEIDLNADDTGELVEVAIDDAGPIVAGTCLECKIVCDADDDLAAGVSVMVLLEPVY